jgi:hypothetical protein
MPKFGVRIWHKHLIAFGGTCYIDRVPNEQAAVEKFVKDGFDQRYWNFEVFAYSVNGEDF